MRRPEDVLHDLDLVGVTEAAQILELSAGMVRYLADTGQLTPCYRIGRKGERMFPRDAVRTARIDREVRELMAGGARRGPKRADRLPLVAGPKVPTA